MQTFATRSENETIAIGRRIGAALVPGDVVLLSGDLGAGKTAFVRGLAEGLGADPEEVSSPTFTLIQKYQGRLTLYHVDLYRLVEKEIADLGLEELPGAHAVVAIEWGEKLPVPIGRQVEVRIEDRGTTDRILTIEGLNTRDDHSTR